jgi:hypothetical protein
MNGRTLRATTGLAGMVAAAAAGALVAGLAVGGVFTPTRPQTVTTNTGTSTSTSPSSSVAYGDQEAELGGSDGLGDHGNADR